MKMRELTCIGCPLGCSLQAEIEDGKVVNVTGNTCPRGKIYAEKECTNPTRILTTSIAVEGGSDAVVSVKTEKDIPKGKIMDALKILKAIKIKAPSKVGDIVVENILDTGVNVVVTRDVEEKEEIVLSKCS
ncbi:DUF1667 domain-containing protein [Clostridium oceanicum]|uniref:DUF1667 domain-containing protein n=1 Tax=Clostridium oceanicum TaxID=1543 RepID=A0ABN1JF87_9CLOT